MKCNAPARRFNLGLGKLAKLVIPMHGNRHTLRNLFLGLLVLFVATVALAVLGKEIVIYDFSRTSATPFEYPWSGLGFDAAGDLHGGADDVEFELTPSSGGWQATIIHQFGFGADGILPNSSPIFDAQGNLYGTTLLGGTGTGTTQCGVNGSCGTVFELSPLTGGGWSEQVIHNFQGGSDGAGPSNYAELVLDAQGNLYGSTYGGGITGCEGADEFPGCGTIYRLSPNSDGTWTEELLYEFIGGADGYNPNSGLVFDSNGNLYGTTVDGGATNVGGTVFMLSPTSSGGWTHTVLYTFRGGPNDGYNPTSGVIFDTAGNLYGTTAAGGSNGESPWTCGGGCGTVYKLSPNSGGGWTETTLYFFQGGANDGAQPTAGMVFDSAGILYGTTTAGHYNYGTVFKLTPNADGGWNKANLYMFGDTKGDGSIPYSPVIFDSSGNLYGTCNRGGTGSSGTVFEITPPAATTTALTSSANPSSYGQAVLFTATVTSSKGAPPNGERVTFKQGSKVLGAGTLSGGAATLSYSALGVGTNDVTAVYGGDATLTSSTSKSLSQVVSQASTTATLTSSLNPSTFGQSVTFTAIVAPQFSGTPTGTVTLKNGASTLGTVTLWGGVAKYTTTKLGVGTESITAVYNGSSSFMTSTSAALSQVVNQASTATTLASSLNPSTFGQSVTFTATVAPQFSGTPTGTVTLKNGAATLGTVTLWGGVAKYTTTKLGVGTESITAVYNGSSSFTTSTSAALSQVVNQASTTALSAR
jgi:hypothetical protein